MNSKQRRKQRRKPKRFFIRGMKVRLKSVTEIEAIGREFDLAFKSPISIGAIGTVTVVLADNRAYVNFGPTILCSPEMVEPLTSGLYYQEFGRAKRIAREEVQRADEILKTRPLADGDIKSWKNETGSVDWDLLNTGAVANNARPDSSSWANLTPEQILKDFNDQLKMAHSGMLTNPEPVPYRNPLSQLLGMNSTFGKFGSGPLEYPRPFYGPSLREMITENGTQNLRQLLNSYEYQSTVNETSDGKIPVSGFVHVEGLKPGPEILPPEETALAVNKPRYRAVSAMEAAYYVAIGAAVYAPPEYQVGGAKFHEISGKGQPTTIEAQKPRLTEGE